MCMFKTWCNSYKTEQNIFFYQQHHKSLHTMITDHIDISLRNINFQTKLHYLTRKHTYKYNEIKISIHCPLKDSLNSEFR